MFGTFTTATHIGRRSYQEDRLLTYVHGKTGTLLAVFDGHGGAECSEYLTESFVTHFYDVINDGKLDIKDGLRNTFATLALLTNDMRSGSTASVVFIPKEEDKAFIAILGDSPVIAESTTGIIHVSPEHNVRTNKEEAKAAEDRGGTIASGYVWNTPNHYSDLARGLQMGRAFGDREMGQIVTKVPEVYEIPLGSWLLLCTDGATDPGHGDTEAAIREIVELVNWVPPVKRNLGQNFFTNDAQSIVDRAVNARTGDNVTAILWRRT
jgi:serine/threonine protein phosphatase PrpC